MALFIAIGLLDYAIEIRYSNRVKVRELLCTLVTLRQLECLNV
jgi:hypothetical protein